MGEALARQAMVEADMVMPVPESGIPAAQGFARESGIRYGDGLVKNRRKTGDFYWVRANVTPVVENNQVTGYISIRGKPARAEIAAAEHAYTALRNGTAKGLALRDAHEAAHDRGRLVARIGVDAVEDRR